MRKRIFIGLLGVVVIGVVVFYLSQPKKGSVEWHKREYLAAHKEPWKVRAASVWNRAFGKAESFPYLPDRNAFERHQDALIRLGYLEKRELIFSNRTAEDILLGRSFEMMRTNLLKDPRLRQLEWEFVDVTPTSGEYSIVIVARRQDMPVLEETLRRADVPGK